MLAALSAVIVLCGCRTSVDVAIDAQDSGGGTVSVAVELDPEALEAVGGSDAIVLDDLDDSAWDLGPSQSVEGGGFRVEAVRSYRDAAELRSVLDSLAGPGVFSGAGSTIEQSFAGSSFAVGVTVEVSGDPAQFSDEALTELLDGLPLGYTSQELTEMGAMEPGAATMTVSLTGPDGSRDEADLDLTSGEPSSVHLEVTGSHRDTAVVVAAVVGSVLVVAGLVVVAVALMRRSRS